MRWMKELGKVYREHRDALFVEVPLSRLEHTMEVIKRHGITTINGISGHDSGVAVEVLYHFIHAGMVLTIKVRISREKPSIPTITGLFPSATLYESENHEMLGIDFVGNANLKPVLFSKDTPKCPLRKKDLGMNLPPKQRKPSSEDK